MHPPDVKAEALELVAAGYNDCEVSRITGIPRTTVRDWRRPIYVPRGMRVPMSTCPRCWRATKPIRVVSNDYSELLGLYLGDGFISVAPRACRLRITLDRKYPRIIDEARALVQRIFPHNAVDVVGWTKGDCVAVSMYSQHLLCLLPQHGAGKKHERRILLERWQRELFEEAPWGFIRGCIRSDGCCFVNRTDVHRPEPYEYVSYDFSNMSDDITGLFVEACEMVGVVTRSNRSAPGRCWRVRINRRDSVALMLEHVGRKE